MSCRMQNDIQWSLSPLFPGMNDDKCILLPGRIPPFRLYARFKGFRRSPVDHRIPGGILFRRPFLCGKRHRNNNEQREQNGFHRYFPGERFGNGHPAGPQCPHRWSRILLRQMYVCRRNRERGRGLRGIHGLRLEERGWLSAAQQGGILVLPSIRRLTTHQRLMTMQRRACDVVLDVTISRNVLASGSDRGLATRS